MIIHTEPGDLVTITVGSRFSIDPNLLVEVLGVRFVAGSGTAPHAIQLAQSGSANTVIDAKDGDTVTLAVSPTMPPPFNPYGVENVNDPIYQLRLAFAATTAIFEFEMLTGAPGDPT